jgi:CRISPR system Cascade subunit CasB
MSQNAFVQHLQKLADPTSPDRGSLAALRRGLGQPPGTVPEMARHVEPFLPDDQWTWRNQTYYLLASLFSQNPCNTAWGNMGDTLCAVAQETSSDSIEGRFIALLKSHRDDLADHLRHAVALASSNDVPVNWEQLLKDMNNWDHPEQFVQRNWARGFWGRPSATNQPEATAAKGEHQ